MKRQRILGFLLVTAALVFGSLELIARLVEHVRTPADEQSGVAGQNADAVPALAFQKIFSSYLSDVTVFGQSYRRPINVDRPGQLFERNKPTGQLRIVVLGASQAGALGLSDAAGYVRQLETFLRQRHPDRDIRVINLSRTGYASAQLALVAKKTLAAIQPDLVVGLFGHNERLDVKVYAEQGRVPPEALALNRALRRNSALVRLIAPRHPAPLGQGDKPLPRLVSDPAWDAFWVARLERAVRDIAAESRRVGAQFVLCTEPANLAYISVREWWWAEDYESDPRLIEARHWLRYGDPGRAVTLLADYAAAKPGPAAEVLWATALRVAGDDKSAKTHFTAALALLESASGITPEQYYYLSVLARLGLGEIDRAREIAQGVASSGANRQIRTGVIGLALQASGVSEEARRMLERARDEDNLAVRAPGKLKEIYRLLGQQIGLKFFDLDEALAATCPGRIPAWDLFIDYCHLNPVGQIRVAGILLPLIERELGLAPDVDNPADAAERLLLDSLFRRQRDFAEFDKWLGVNDDLIAISNEKIDSHPENYTAAPRDAAGACFMGNYQAENVTGEANVTRAAEEYRRALSIDPTFRPAQSNLDHLRQLYRNGIFP